MKMILRIPLLMSRLLVLTAMLVHSGCGESAPSTPISPKDTTSVPITGDSLYLAARATGVFTDGRLLEISGIAPSRERDDILWVHNDSGDKARVFAVDTGARLLAEVLVEGATNVDWEDMATARIGGTSRLYIADVGDNGAARKQISIYRCAEPFIDPLWRDTTISIPSERMVLLYPDGARDCEAMFVDASNETMYLIAKTGNEACGIYRIPWKTGETPTILEHVGELRIPAAFSFLRLVTAADLSGDASAVLVRTYTALYEFRGNGTPSELLALTPRSLPGLPAQVQGEAACFSRNARGIFLATEGGAQPLHFIPRRGDR